MPHNPNPLLHILDQDQDLDALPPMSLDRFQEMSGWSPATLWRFRKKGWLRTLVISGRHYVTRKEILAFNKRAASGEFAGKVANPSKYKLREQDEDTNLALAA